MALDRFWLYFVSLFLLHLMCLLTQLLLFDTWDSDNWRLALLFSLIFLFCLYNLFVKYSRSLDLTFFILFYQSLSAWLLTYNLIASISSISSKSSKSSNHHSSVYSLEPKFLVTAPHWTAAELAACDWPALCGNRETVASLRWSPLLISASVRINSSSSTCSKQAATPRHQPFARCQRTLDLASGIWHLCAISHSFHFSFPLLSSSFLLFHFFHFFFSFCSSFFTVQSIPQT